MKNRWIRALAAAAAATLLAACAGGPATRAMTSDDMFARVQPGMSQDEVRGMFGTPYQVMPFPLSHNVAWTYIAYDTWGYMVDFSVTFGPDGRAVSRFSRRINDGADHGSR
ncbi:MAG TPA: outer membrane protein assembly factor BamE [Usitatibacter sp.]|nr:outer membrane protein assembly factor BamE [Usitatibacter sp.]